MRQVLYHVSDHREDEFGHFHLYRIGYLLPNIRIGRETQVIVSVDDESQESKFYDEPKDSSSSLGTKHPIYTVDLFGVGDMFVGKKHREGKL